VTALTADITTGSAPALNVCNLDVSTKDVSIINSSTINCCDIVATGAIGASSVEGALLTATSNLATHLPIQV